MPLQRIRPAVQALESTIGIEHALASRSLHTDGAEVLYDYAEREADDLLELQLVVVRTGQHQSRAGGSGLKHPPAAHSGFAKPS